ncbi:MAG: DNA repair protein RadA [Deltaproteobacteria bacterium]|nr:MAG: DNA repair protein RadA [Deltaproteobacteria bacterium]
MGRKPRIVYGCIECGHQAPKWLGRCPECGSWGSLVEETAAPGPPSSHGAHRLGGGGSPVPLPEVDTEATPRRPTGLAELDRVLGGGLVPGSVVLIGGDPGIGKSTLLLMACQRLAAQGPVLYVSGEESLSQIRLRAERLGVDRAQILLLAETDGSRVLAEAERLAPAALVVDSIQTLHLPEIGSAPGSVSQVRELTGRLLGLAKRRGIPTFLVGHVTKEGAIAGPRLLEHMVDTVLYFEGDRSHAYRILRAHKNRFGSVSEIGVFEMRREGLAEVPDPSALFLSERPAAAPGSVVAATVSGSRPVLVEVQALVSQAPAGQARRTALGIDRNRLSLLVAVLEKRLGLTLFDQDAYVNVAGGLTVDEPALDLAVALAVLSSFRGQPVDPQLVVLGEVGLAGEIRAVAQVEQRLAEAAKMGFTTALVPEGNRSRLSEEAPILVRGVRTLEEAVEAAL